jgi:membrane protein DedA with SNARE-associated domain
MNSSWIGIFLGTFVLEDVALVGALSLIGEGQLSILGAFTSCFTGIAIGDIALYALGYGFKRIHFLRNNSFVSRHMRKIDIMETPSLGFLIFVSRAVPGLRLPTYLASGFLEFSFFGFLVLTIASVALWVGIVLIGGAAILNSVASHRWLVLFLIATVFLFSRSILGQLLDPWERKALRYKWRRLLYFEFWPSWIFYLPIVPYYIYLSLKGRSFLLPFYANPRILNGGLIGESKWDFLKHLRADQPTTLNAVLLPQYVSTTEAFSQIENAGITYPLVLKPDVGQRGYAVRIIRSRQELESDLLLRSKSSTAIVQTLSQFQKEAGIFYFRRPSSSIGTIFSITDKEFPFLIADGKTSFGDLILQDPRARIIASVYFARHRSKLDQVFEKGVRIYLTECGNHCQGAVFKNGVDLMSGPLLEKIDSIAKQIPEFYFGRFDVRYANPEQLRLGLDFEIVEINGAASEATHIWDRRTSLFEAYKTLFIQWNVLFEIGREVKTLKIEPANIRKWLFLKECFKVARRSDEMSVSS